jgi:hypothetical protein
VRERVCVRERHRERERGTEYDRRKETERRYDCVCVCVCDAETARNTPEHREREGTDARRHRHGQQRTSPARFIMYRFDVRLHTSRWSRCRGINVTELHAASTTALGCGGFNVRIQSEVL